MPSHERWQCEKRLLAQGRSEAFPPPILRASTLGRDQPAMRRQHVFLAVLVLLVVCVLWTSSSDDGIHAYTSLSFGLRSDACPNPLAPLPQNDKVRKPVCSSLPTNPTHARGVQVDLCLSSTVPNHGWFQIERTDKAACARTDSILTSHDAAIDTVLRAKGPDFFHIQFDGEQRWITEVDVEYLGRCTYRYPFRLVSAAPVNISIWWPFQNYRAAIETSELALQYDRALPVLEGVYQMLYPYPPQAQACPPVGAVASSRAWRSPALDAFVQALPECCSFTPTPGVYLKAHHSELPDATFQKYVYQPVGCRWSNPLLYGAPPEQTQRGFKPRSMLFIGDSHARYVYDLLAYAYTGDWANFMKAPAMKKLEKSDTFGPVKLDFVWEAVLLELRIKLNCTTAAKYDTVVLGAGQHNAIRIPAEKDHSKQWSMKDWSALTADIARRLAPEACPGQKMPKVVWMGNPARIMRVEPAKESPWVDARSSWRIRLYDEIAWGHFEKIGAARVDMFSLSQPFVNDFKDTLHMRHTDSLMALIQEVHQKIQPTQPAYAHLEDGHDHRKPHHR